MPHIDAIAQERLEEIRTKQMLRDIRVFDRTTPSTQLSHDGKLYVSFCCNDYLGLTNHPSIKQASIDAIKQYGTGAGASRLVSGNHSLYPALETQLSTIKKTESALVFGSGYLANIGTIPALVDNQDLIVMDRLVHACLIDGAKLSGAKIIRYHHCDMISLEEQLKRYRHQYRHCLIITDHVFSMDGTVAPMDTIGSLADTYDAWVMSDDAHGLGTVLPYGEYTPHIQMGTLSKALGSYGGYVCASQVVIDLLKNKARSVIYTTALPPAVIASAMAALDVIAQNPSLTEQPLAHAQYFTKTLGLPNATSPIVPLILHDEHKALAASEVLFNEGFLVQAIRPPTVPNNSARLRFTFCANHDRSQIDRVIDIINTHTWV